MIFLLSIFVLAIHQECRDTSFTSRYDLIYCGTPVTPPDVDSPVLIAQSMIMIY